MNKARARLEILLEHIPEDTVTSARQHGRYPDSPETRRCFDGMRLAGLPEQVPDPVPVNPTSVCDLA